MSTVSDDRALSHPVGGNSTRLSSIMSKLGKGGGLSMPAFERVGGADGVRISGRSLSRSCNER